MTRGENKDAYCSICGGPNERWNTRGYGNDAMPINDGRCCNQCNDMVVTPARFRVATVRKANDE
jgi:hypothetical protein